jgi:hypothetical protein
MRDFASRRFGVIFAHGFEYTDAALKVGSKDQCDQARAPIPRDLECLAISD